MVELSIFTKDINLRIGQQPTNILYFDIFYNLFTHKLFCSLFVAVCQKTPEDINAFNGLNLTTVLIGFIINELKPYR